MKQSPQMTEIQNRMLPGAITLEGFLGPDARTLAEIIDVDDMAVRRLGVAHRQIAARMKEFAKLGGAGLGEFVSVGDNFEVRVDGARGKLPCPFGHPGIFRKTNTTVRNKKLGVELSFSDLQIHMIEHHGFYEGRGSAFRLDPATLCAVLEIEKGPAEA